MDCRCFCCDEKMIWKDGRFPCSCYNDTNTKIIKEWNKIFIRDKKGNIHKVTKWITRFELKER